MSAKISIAPINFKEKQVSSDTDIKKIKPNEENKLERQPESDTLEVNNSNNRLKQVAIGTLGLGAIAILGDIVFAKGKHIKKIFGMAEKDAKASVETRTEQTFADFKSNGGKFSDKKLLDKDGNPFSGNLMQESKNGKKYIFEYKDGLVQKVESMQKVTSGDIPLSTKSFTYNSNGKIASVTKESIVMDKGKVKNIKIFEYNSDGKIKSVIDKSEEKIIDKPFETHFNYDSKGNLTSIRTKTEKMVDGKVKTVEETKNINKKGGTDNGTGKSSGNSQSKSADSSSSTGSYSSGGSSYSGSYSSNNAGRTTSSGNTGRRTTTGAGRQTTSGTASSAERLQQELAEWNKHKDELMQEMEGVANANFYIKDGKVMMDISLTDKFTQICANETSMKAPEQMREKVYKIVYEYFESLLKDVKVSGPAKEYKNIMSEWKNKVANVMSEENFKNLNQKFIKQYGINYEELFKKLNAEEAQARFNKPFEDLLSNKSAKESAEVFEEQMKKDVAEALEEIEAREAEAFEIKAAEAQAKFNKPFEEAISNKSASDSARVFDRAFDNQRDATVDIARTIAREGGISQEAIREYAIENGFREVNKTVHFADGTSAHVIYEGYGYDITSEGKLLKKVFANSKTTYTDVTEEAVTNAREQMAEEARARNTYYSGYNYQHSYANQHQYAHQFA